MAARGVSSAVRNWVMVFLLTGVIGLVSACSGGNASTSIQPVEVTAPTPTSTEPPISSESPLTVEPGIVITPMKTLELDQYSEFTYQEASTVGLSPEATKVANGVLAAMTEPWVAEAVAENKTEECMEEEDKCGFFSLTLEWLPCEDGLLCVKQTVDKASIGMATGGSGSVSIVRLDPGSGADVSLDVLLGADGATDFLRALNETATLILKVNDMFYEERPPRYDLASLPAWLPESDGIRVWFPKYDVGPGALGIVEIVMRKTDDGYRGEPTPPREENVASSYDVAYDYICDSDVEDLPRLVNRFATPYAVSVLQLLLGDLTGYSDKPLYRGMVSGQYDAETRRAVEDWQTYMSIQVDGVVGPQTWNTLQYHTCWHEEFPASEPAEQTSAGLAEEIQRNWNASPPEYKSYLCTAAAALGPTQFRQMLTEPLSDLQWEALRELLKRECNL